MPGYCVLHGLLLFSLNTKHCASPLTLDYLLLKYAFMVLLWCSGYLSHVECACFCFTVLYAPLEPTYLTLLHHSLHFITPWTSFSSVPVTHNPTTPFFLEAASLSAFLPVPYTTLSVIPLPTAATTFPAAKPHLVFHTAHTDATAPQILNVAHRIDAPPSWLPFLCVWMHKCRERSLSSLRTTPAHL